MKSALVVGATGLIGKCVCDGLSAVADLYPGIEIQAWVRNNHPDINPRVLQREIDFEDMQLAAKDQRFDAVFCCLGTTMAAAGGREQFQRVDYHYPLALAQLAAQWGNAHFLLVSAVNANAYSPVFYSRTKGILERDAAKVGLARLSIFRPSLLLGEREEMRFAENVAGMVMPAIDWALPGRFARFRSIEGVDVAKAMVMRAWKPDEEIVCRKRKDAVGDVEWIEYLGMRGLVDDYDVLCGIDNE